MDPLSITTAVVTLVTAAAQISKALSRLRAFGEFPTQINALKDEVTDLEVILRQIAQRLSQSSIAPAFEHDSLKHLLVRANVHLVGIANGLERVAKVCTKNRIKLIASSSIWREERSSFQPFQAELQSIKTSLTLVLSASNAHDLHSIMLELRQITILTNAAMSRATNPSSDEHLWHHQHDALTTRMQAQYHGLQDQLNGLGSLIRSSNSVRKVGFVLPEDEKSSHVRTGASEDRSVTIEYNTLTCRGWCPCACHATGKTKIGPSGHIASLTGKLVLGYAGLPVFNPACDFKGCREKQKSKAIVEYWLPWWLASMNVRMSMRYRADSGLHFQLSTNRRVPDTAQSVAYALQGNIEGLKYLFGQGLASPRDVSDSRGYSLMRWALYGGMHQYKTVRFLMSAGANVDDISYDNVWDFLLRGRCNATEQHELRCVTEQGDGDWLEEQNFPLIHRIIFGMSGKSLAAEIDDNPLAVYQTDAQGRTALDWATARAQLEDISTLLAAGADANTMDVSGRTTVLHAVDSHKTEALRLVLAAGGHPDPRLPKGILRSSPLTAAGFGGLRDMLRLLLEFGASPNACNPEGFTALHSVARTKNLECAQLLLEYGADPTIVSTNGRTPLCIALINNNHPVLQLFLRHLREYTTRTPYCGPDMLCLAAEHGDNETLSILSQSRLLRYICEPTMSTIANSQGLLKARRDYDEKLAGAFEEMLHAAQSTSIAVSPTDSCFDSQLFLSAKSSFHSLIAEALSELDSDPDEFDERSVDEDLVEDQSEQETPTQEKEYV